MEISVGSKDALDALLFAPGTPRADFVILAKEGRAFHCHSAILAQWSEVLAGLMEAANVGADGTGKSVQLVELEEEVLLLLGAILCAAF